MSETLTSVSAESSAAGRPVPLSVGRQVLGLVGFLVLVFAAAALGSALTTSSLGPWYESLNKPSWNPPNWVFGPVWTVIYIMMAVAAWLVWRRDGWRQSQVPLAWFAVQLALNVAWSGLFFGLRSPGLALVDIAALWIALAITATLFWRRVPAAGVLLVPYLAWSSFAAVLNATIWRLN